MRRERLRYLLRPREVTNRADLQVLSVYRDHGVVPKGSRSDNFNKTPDDLTRYQEVRVGDLVVNKMKAWQGSVGISAYHGIVSPDYLVCGLLSGVDPRHLHYLLRSPALAAEFVARSKGVRPSQWRLYWEDLADVVVTLPPLVEQRRIADFLDHETSRLSAIQALMEAARSSLIDREQVNRDVTLENLAGVHGFAQFRRYISFIEQGSSPLCENSPAFGDCWGVLKVSAVKDGAFFESENKMLPTDVEPILRYEIRSGDLLITRANTPTLVGAAAVAKSPRRLLMLCDKIFRVRTSPDLRPEFLVHVSLTSRTRALCAEASHGTSASMTNLKTGDIKAWPIPCAPVAIQRVVERELDNAREEAVKLINVIDRQLALLAERRQALITAAVTGQIDVSTARGVEV